jgi:hypothetical protein
VNEVVFVCPSGWFGRGGAGVVVLLLVGFVFYSDLIVRQNVLVRATAVTVVGGLCCRFWKDEGRTKRKRKRKRKRKKKN